MTDLKAEILELEKISEELEPSASERDEFLRQVHDYVNRFINDLGNSKTFSDEKPDSELLAIKRNKNPLAKIIGTFSEEVAGKGINAASGGHLGYVPGGGIYASALADYLAAVTNEYAGLFYASPGAVIMENEILKWLKSIFGYPADAAGSLTSGGSVANLIGLTAARDMHKVKSEKIKESVVYLSSQTHHCIHKALKIIGLEDIILRYCDLDENSRINAEKLEAQIVKDKAGGLYPFLIIASAGTTGTGAVDPLTALGNIARKHHLWYHVDAAYGGFFILTAGKKEMFKGIEMADSLVVDPHKGLFIPYGTGAALIKNRKAVLHSHHYTAHYMQDSRQNSTLIMEPADVSPELTRHFRALRIWLPLQLHGLKPFIACLEEKILLTEYFRYRLLESGFKTGPEPDLSISYFWYPYGGENEDNFNRKLLQMIHKDGTIFFSSTIVNKKFVIRLAVLSFRTKLYHIEKALDILNVARLKLTKTF